MADCKCSLPLDVQTNPCNTREQVNNVYDDWLEEADRLFELACKSVMRVMMMIYYHFSTGWRMLK